MLPPFRICQLRASDNPAGPDVGDDFTSSPVPYEELAVIRISSTEYDSVIQQHPDAALTYMDEDDGEIITVSLTMQASLLDSSSSQCLGSRTYSDTSFFQDDFFRSLIEIK